MTLLACGINHQTAPLAIREQVVFAPDSMPTPLLDLVASAGVEEAAILSTCNRTEIYCTSNDPIIISDWLHKHRYLPAGHLHKHFYCHQDQAAVRHMLRVASGLDSMVIGEPQILGQFKAAFSWAQTAGTLGARLQHLFQYVFSIAKQVRTETAIGAQPVSIAYAAINLAKHIFADLNKLTVLLIGAGEMVELTARHLQAAGIKNFYIANRTVEHAEKLAEQLHGRAIGLADIAEYLPQVDIVVAATSSPIPILGKGVIERALKIRKRRPMFMVDFAVPRDIEPEVAELNDVYLYTMDDLHNIIQKNQSVRHEAASKAEVIIDQQAGHYMQSLKVLEAVPVIRAYRNQAEKIRDSELIKAQQLLQAGISPEEVLQRLANTLTNKLLHAPTSKLRAAAYDNQEEVLSVARKLFE